MNVQNFSFTAGEDRTLSMTASNQAGTILNLTGATIVWRLSKGRGGTAVLDIAGAIVSAAAGTFTVTLTDTNTEDLSGAYYHQAIVTISGTTTVAVAGRVLVGDLNQPVFN